MADDKKIVLEINTKSYVNKEGKLIEFIQYGVTVNGIFLELKPADNTVRQVLASTFGV